MIETWHHKKEPALTPQMRALMKDPEAFWKRIISLANPSFSLLQDALVTHLKQNPIAFKQITANGKSENFTYRDLFTLVEQKLPYQKDAPLSIQKIAGFLSQGASVFDTLDARTAMLHALRDGRFVLGLKPGTTWLCDHTPYTLLIALMSGATITHISPDLLQENPSILIKEKIDLMGISPLHENLWKEQRGMPQVKLFYKSPLTTLPVDWIKVNALEKTCFMHLHFSNEHGGITLFSRPSLEDPRLKAACGVESSLTALNGTKHSDFGILSVNDVPSHLICAQVGEHLILSGTTKPLKGLEVYPVEETEHAVNGLSFITASMIISSPKTGQVAQSTLHLLAFVGAVPLEEAKWTEEIAQAVQVMPDRITFLPLIPKMIGSLIDRNWCLDQYHSGHLYKKVDMPIYRLLTQCKAALHQTPVASVS